MNLNDFGLANMSDKDVLDAVYGPNRDGEGAAGLFPQMSIAAVCAAAQGKLDMNKLALQSLAARGYDATGKWVGFPEARRLFSEGGDGRTVIYPEGPINPWG